MKKINPEEHRTVKVTVRLNKHEEKELREYMSKKKIASISPILRDGALEKARTWLKLEYNPSKVAEPKSIKLEKFRDGALEKGKEV